MVLTLIYKRYKDH